MNKVTQWGIAGLLGIAAVPVVSADYRGYEWARVTDVQPIVRTVTVATPHRTCWTEEVTRVHARGEPGAVLAGALIGGAIGSQFGSGNGRRAATVAGILIGSQIGSVRSRSLGPVTTVEERCDVRTSYREERQVEGYRVTYVYRGAAYVTYMQSHPGNRIRVRVSVRPASL